MKNVNILIPVYNDWESLFKLLKEIDKTVSTIKEFKFTCVIVNDCSTTPIPKIITPSNIASIKLFNMKKNKGHARSNAFGIKYLAKKDNFDYLIVMDGDGEDRPEEIKAFCESIISEPDISVVAKRVKRSEGPFFQLLYQIHKLLTLVFTGKNINFGNYSCLTKNDVKFLSGKKSLWSSFSGSVKKHIVKLNSINSTRGKRYFGPSKMSFINLLLHSFAIIAVFKNIVFIRSAVLIFAISYIELNIGIFLQICLVIFNLIIFVVAFREKEREFLDSETDLKNIEEHTH